MNVVIIASGPSLTASDCEDVWKVWERGECSVIVVNNSFRIASWADICYAADYDWFDRYYAEARLAFGGEFVTGDETACDRWPELTHVPCQYGTHLRGASICSGGVNGHSGFQALCLAVQRGFKNITLLGFDCQHDKDKKHWHDDHGEGLGNAVRPDLWIDSYKELAPQLLHRGVKVANATRSTALNVFPCKELAQCLKF